jgi:tetratricopeptide (TPR) repeat protein
MEDARRHLEQAVAINAYHLTARALLAVVARLQHRTADAEAQLAAIERIDPTSLTAASERWLLTAAPAAQAELLRLLGRQSQEAIGATTFYRTLALRADAYRILKLVAAAPQDPFGTPAEFFYLLAHNAPAAEAPAWLARARAARANIDRFPYREESLPALEWAVRQDPKDSTALFLLACLEYSLNRPTPALAHWEAAAAADPQYFSARRALGLAYAEQGRPATEAASQLEKAVALNPSHMATLNDLSALYARAGRFDEQLALLHRAFERAPSDDNLAEQILAANLVKCRYADAQAVVDTHKFQPRHRSYGLRDKYRFLQFGLAAAAFRAAQYDKALAHLQSAQKPPVTLGVDDFANQVTPRMAYYQARVLEAQGQPDAARKLYEQNVAIIPTLSGDRDSWSADNVYILYSLDRLNRRAEADRLVSRFENFARTEIDSRNPAHQVASRYVLALLARRAGRQPEAAKLLEEAVSIQPDAIPPRLEQRADSIN